MKIGGMSVKSTIADSAGAEQLKLNKKAIKLNNVQNS
jgi:hypothetical protein